MRHYAKYILLMTATALTACSDNEADTPDDKSNPDPVGTVSTTMYNEDNGDSYLGSLHIDRDGNFVGCDMTMISGANGLSDVASIPKSGYSGTSKVMPKTCYVTYLDGEWCRLYVEKTISTSKASATGANIKYQKPFKGKDEVLLLSESEIGYAAEGGNTIVTINNSSIIPFSATSSAEWCNVTIGSTLEQPYLTDAVSIDILPSNSTKDETATVSLTTLYGKTTTITITRRGVVPSIEMEQNIRIGHSAKEFTIPVTTNLPLSDLSVGADVDWLSVELAAVDKAETTARPLRWLGDNPVAPIKAKSPSAPAPETIIVKCVAKANTDTERSATITISSKDGQTSADTQLQQIGMYIDLGLSVKWATCNLGADVPEEYGYYYAWGETSTKNSYTHENYKFYYGKSDSYSKYNVTDGLTTLKSEDDAATVSLGEPWRMPTNTEATELRLMCNWFWTSINGTTGYRLTGPNGNSIFMPCCGQYSIALDLNDFAKYWTSSLYLENPVGARSIYFNKSITGKDYSNSTFSRYYGQCIRPVKP